MLYSIQCDFKGGTYIDQVKAVNIVSAAKAWANNLDVTIVEGLSVKNKTKIISELQDEDNFPIPLQDRINIWVVHLIIDDSTLYAYFYATASPSL